MTNPSSGFTTLENHSESSSVKRIFNESCTFGGSKLSVEPKDIKRNNFIGGGGMQDYHAPDPS